MRSAGVERLVGPRLVDAREGPIQRHVAPPALLPITAIIASHELNRLDPFDVLHAVNAWHNRPQRRAMLAR